MVRHCAMGSVLLFAAMGPALFAQSGAALNTAPLYQTRNCDEPPFSHFCIDRYTGSNYEGEYVGHDEPSVLFYDTRAGSGNHMVYNLILPKDPPTLPRQDGTGGTWNFQLHIAFWFGMAICDTQSAPNPNPNGTCAPDSDANIFSSTNPLAADYVGKHPGTAFLELQFYPPGWISAPDVISPTQYTAALNIDSFSLNMNTGQNNNSDCLNTVGQEPVNFATITKNGVPLYPANPLGTPFGASNPDLSNVLVMNPGDLIRIEIQDSPGGVMVTIQDLTTGQSGSMIGGPAAGFGQVNWAPAASTCSVRPYAFHPMYSTSSESTTVPWAAHTYNIAFSDEIGHFELCNAFNGNPNSPNFLRCTAPGPEENILKGGSFLDSDDYLCLRPSFFGIPSPPFIDITGCIGDDLDFDGHAYGLNWPGSNPNVGQDPLLRPTPVRFTSPAFVDSSGTLRDYERAAFETDIPAFDAACDVRSGIGCVNPPTGAAFYPMYTTTFMPGGVCYWQFGGPNIPETSNTFGGSATIEFGGLTTQVFPTFLGPQIRKLNFHQTIGANPCTGLGK